MKKASAHCGRTFDKVHNDRTFDPEKADSHINTEMTKYNVYWNVYDGEYSDTEKDDKLSFQDAERKYYTEHYNDALNLQNEKYIARRQYARCKTIDDLLTSKNTMTETTLYQVGRKGNIIEPDKLLEIYKDYRSRVEEKYGKHMHIVSWAMHVDETSVHIHEKKVWDYKDKDGNLKIGQTKALEQLGFQLPDPNQKSGRNNNLKMSYTEEMRKLWYQVIREHGIEIDETVQTPSKKHLEKLEYQNEQEKAENIRLKNENDRLIKENVEQAENLQSLNDLYEAETMNIDASLADYQEKCDKKIADAQKKADIAVEASEERIRQAETDADKKVKEAEKRADKAIEASEERIESMQCEIERLNKKGKAMVDKYNSLSLKVDDKQAELADIEDSINDATEHLDRILNVSEKAINEAVEQIPGFDSIASGIIRTIDNITRAVREDEYER